MNVYDFDKTIYQTDSSVDFWRFCLRRHPGALRALPKQIAGIARYALRRIDKTRMKQAFYSYFACIPDMQQEIELFWQSHESRLMPWYLRQKQADDVIVSASPAFLLAPVCERLGVRLIASDVDPRTGETKSPNCRGAEKVRRFREAYGDAAIEGFYSDSHSDEPMARLAKQAFLVQKNAIVPWRISEKME